VNGDGFDDLIVGAPQYDHGQTGEGRAFVFYGSATGPSKSPDWIAESNQTGADFGVSVGTAGDVNGDGYDDVIVGADSLDAAFVFHGSPNGLSRIPNWSARADQSSAFGTSVGTAGDVNGDGYDDVVVGAIYYDNGQTDEGRAFLYEGSASGLNATPSWTAESDQASAYFGNSVGTAGDTNHDGYADVIVGAYFYDNNEDNEGRAYMYEGSADGLNPVPSWTAEADQASAFMGYSVATAGDVNGDGYDDVVAGAVYDDHPQPDEGRAFVFEGSASGLSAAPDWTGESNQISAYFGWSVGGGDVNGDGYDDVIVGAISYDHDQVDEGRMFIYDGSANGLSAAPDGATESYQDSAWFGWSVGVAGDVNHDGYGDVIVGSPFYGRGQTSEGRAYVYGGQPDVNHIAPFGPAAMPSGVLSAVGMLDGGFA
jgi:FG-GAP repeat/FG-GAP-like repeat